MGLCPNSRNLGRMGHCHLSHRLGRMDLPRHSDRWDQPDPMARWDRSDRSDPPHRTGRIPLRLLASEPREMGRKRILDGLEYFVRILRAEFAGKRRMTRLELEARRLSIIPELDAGVSIGRIASRLDVSRTSVYRWKRARERGSALKRHKAPGRPPRLTATQIEACKAAYVGPINRKTQNHFAVLIEKLTGVTYDPDHVGRLMHKWGLRPKRERKHA